MIKDMLVGLSLGAGRDAAADYAVSVAEILGAHLVGVALTHDVVIPPEFLGAMPVSLIEAQREDVKRQASAALARFDETTRRAGLSAESRVMAATAPSISRLFARIARRFDLAVVSQAEPDHGVREELVVEAALFESGRPIIAVPYIHRRRLKLDRVLVCWDGSRAAARALADAMPFLQRAIAIDLIMVANEPPKSDEVPGAEIGQHLARHGFTVEVKQIVAPDIPAANAILSYAADTSADLVVMGGYGHSRLREFVLGGVTRGMRASMTVPILMSH